MYETQVLSDIGSRFRVQGRTPLHSSESDVECAESGGRNADDTTQAVKRLEFEARKEEVDILSGGQNRLNEKMEGVVAIVQRQNRLQEETRKLVEQNRNRR